MRWDELEEWLGEVVTVPRVFQDHYLQPKDAINLNDILMFIVETEEERDRLKDEWIVSPSMFCCPVGAENLIGTQCPVLHLLELTSGGLEARKEKEKKLTDKGKGFIMDMYFEQCYGE